MTETIENSQRRQALLGVYRNGLLEDTLPFWQRFGVDEQHGGFLTSLDHDGTLLDDDKGIWQQARFTWLLGELYNNNPTDSNRETWLALAEHGIRFIDQHGFDPADGRMWFHVTRSGQPIRKRRYAFSESFAAIAYGELYQATGRERYANRARSCFQAFVDHHRADHLEQAKFTAVRPTCGLDVPMITIVTAQQLQDSIGLTDAGEWIDRSIELIRRWHVHDDIECVMETVGANGERLDHFDGRTLNPGHAIEGAWFIMNEGKIREDSELIQLGCRMLDWMWARGWDEAHGGMLYFCSVDDRPISEYWHDMKFWWPHCETIIATLLAWHLTGDAKYARWHQLVHDWTYAHFPDPEHGEWFGYLHRDGRRSSTLKGNLWKGPFHLPRMQWTCAQILAEIDREH